MRYTLVLLFLLCVGSASAQVRSKFYYNKQWELTTQDHAAFVRVCLFDTTNMYFVGPITDLYVSGKPQMKGSYSRLAKEGPFTFFYENGNTESQGNFFNDKPMGPWKFFYPDGTAKPESEADLNSLLSKFSVTENFMATDSVDFTTYPVLGHMVRGGETFLKLRTEPEESETIYDIKPKDDQGVVVPPSPNGDIVEMYRFIGSHMHYPPNARRTGVQGVVSVQYVVEKTGLISQITVQKGIGSGCDEEAVRVMVEYAKTVKWNPATREGKPVRSRMVIPITFKLG